MTDEVPMTNVEKKAALEAMLANIGKPLEPVVPVEAPPSDFERVPAGEE